MVGGWGSGEGRAGAGGLERVLQLDGGGVEGLECGGTCECTAYLREVSGDESVVEEKINFFG